MHFNLVSKATYPAFLVHLSGSSSSSPIVFNRVHSRYSHGYSTTSGKFTADRDGVYIFLHNIEADSRIVTTTLRVNGENKAETRSDGRHSGYDDSAVVSVLQLFTGDQVYVAIQTGTADDGQSLFFGVLLYEL